jgi:hypothetical protein
MFPSPVPSLSNRRRGVALIIVLAFVVLLTGLIVAFFSRAISERQISNASASQARVDQFAQNAFYTVIGDLNQEIAAGSTLPSNLPAGVSVYVPATPAAAVPSLVGVALTDKLPNLVKRSANGKDFFDPAAFKDASGQAPNSGNYPPSKRATAISTLTASLNGRTISPARWNKPLLLPKAKPDSDTDFTPYKATAATATAAATWKSIGGTDMAPDWIVVARDGSNPTAWASTLTATGSNAAVGRFAYNIYDEGGLLDINAAGYPSGDIPSSLGKIPAYKNSLAFADLRLLPGFTNGTDSAGQTIKGLQADTSAPGRADEVLRTVVGWRNYASTGIDPTQTSPTAGTPVSGSVNAGYTWSASNAKNYLNLMQTLGTGFLRTANPLIVQGQSDRPFVGRQQLMNLLFNSVANQSQDSAGSAERAALQNSLQYVGTFSRGLEQPSFAPLPASASPNATHRPAILDAAKGGNNANGLDDAINPSFLSVRVATPKTGGRNDGSDLAVGEPLVKKRFALNRLAWLTYAGPITLDGKSYNPDVSLTYVTALKNTYGFTDAFLWQGTDANIQKYFGLRWGSGRWSYNLHNRGGITGAIRKLSYPSDSADVLRANREADFFELLKAAINVGSIAKTATNPTPTNLPGGTIGSYQTQYNEDSAVDGAIIQMGANIIDQFDLDGYATRINFNDSDTGAPGNAKEFRGVENLPYLSRLTHALVKVKQVDPTLQTLNGVPNVIKNSGVGAVLQCPELWNPHDYKTSDLNQSAGIVGPTKFRIYAESGTAGVNNTVSFSGIIRVPGAGNGNNHTQADAAKSPGFQSMYGWTYLTPEKRILALANTELDFTIDKSTTGVTRFREPTILFQPSSVDTSPAISNFGIIGSNAGFFVGNGFKSDVDSGVSGVPPVRGNGYVGFYLGALPLYWYSNVGNYFWLDSVSVNGVVDVHYYLQYQDASGAWATYDEKFRTLGGSGAYSENAGLAAGGDHSAAANGWQSFIYHRPIPKVPAGYTSDQWDSCYAVMDPRTSRFHLMKFTSANGPYWNYPPYVADPTGAATRAGSATKVGYTFGWIDAVKGITLPLRDGTNDGASFMCPVGVFPTSMGWNPGSVAETTGGRFSAYNNLTLGNVTGNHLCRPGMFSQNNPFARRNNRIMGDDGDPGSMDSFGAPPPGPSNAAQFYTDPDGVVRRAVGGLVPYDSSGGKPATSNVGLPMTAASTSDSRPMILNRPFRTVGELGYTFSGTPWKNLNFNMPESGDSALLDVFCVNDTDDANGLVAGKVNLNTRQAPVLQAIIAGAYKDEWNSGTATIAGGTGSVAENVAAALVRRTTVGPKAGLNAGKPQPLSNVSELVGKWVQNVAGDTAISGGASTPIINPKSYDGFIADLIDNRYTGVGEGVFVDPNSPDKNYTIPRFADATLRALANSGQTRVWNLLIDVVAQTGRYPQSAGALDKFSVEGEQRYWVHVAIDRLTGQIIDKQIEVVKE